jgi:hypothetical protein
MFSEARGESGRERPELPRSLPGRFSGDEEARVVEFCFVREDVRVAIGRHGEVALADPLADPRPGDAAQVEQGDAAMPKIVRAPDDPSAYSIRTQELPRRRASSAAERSTSFALGGDRLGGWLLTPWLTSAAGPVGGSGSGVTRRRFASRSARAWARSRSPLTTSPAVLSASCAGRRSCRSRRKDRPLAPAPDPAPQPDGEPSSAREISSPGATLPPSSSSEPPPPRSPRAGFPPSPSPAPFPVPRSEGRLGSRPRVVGARRR